MKLLKFLKSFQVLMASSSPNDIERGSVIEAPLTINIPRTKHPFENPQVANSVSGVSISVPVFVPTQPLPTVPSAEGLDNANGGTNNTNLPPRRKRKPWSAVEDRELFAAVQKYGEGNWTHIVKSDFKGDRTASQLSQRWNIIKKRQNHPLMKTGSQLSEAQLAARRALNMALDKPGLDIPKPASSLGTNLSHRVCKTGGWVMGQNGFRKTV
ncbi:putative transcription factor MYB-HB-like family [Helianthus annuus]|nr:putative transcription factor MYB-HB-like family [Helianthus annuus]